jgi:hypothetical protein
MGDAVGHFRVKGLRRGDEQRPHACARRFGFRLGLGIGAFARPCAAKNQSACHWPVFLALTV